MTEFQPFQRRSFWGEVHPDYLDQLEALLSRIEAPNRGRILKEGSARILWVEDLASIPLCFKEYHLVGTGDRIAKMLRGSRSRREWVRLKELYAHSVPVPQPILWVETGETGGWVVTEYLPDTVSLSEALNLREDFTPQAYRDLAERLGRALALMHKAGARHDDLHAGNILVRMDREDPQPYIVDLHQVALKRSLSWETRLRNLGRLLGGIQERVDRRLRQRCFRSYLRTLSDWNPPFETEKEARRSMGAAVEKFARRDYERRWRKRVDKCQEPGKRFHRLRIKGYSGWVRAEWDRPDLLSLLEDPNGWIGSDLCRILKHTPTTTVACGRLPDSGQQVFVKRYNRKDLWERSKNLFRRSRSMKVWRSGYALELLEIPAPKTVCALEKRVGPLLLESFIVTEWVEEGVGFDDFYRARCGPGAAHPLSVVERNRLEQAVASLFRRLHSHGISHGDLKGRNVLLNPNAPAPFDPQFVDLDAMNLRPIRFRRERINDLARLLFSVYPIPSLLRQVRFFKRYAKGDSDLWTDRKTWWKAIWRRTRRKFREKGIA